jgi:hypothetical protein
MQKETLDMAENYTEGKSELEIDLDVLRIDVTPTTGMAVKKLLTAVAVGKPKRQDWFRTHPSPEYRSNVAILKLENEDEFFLVTPAMVQELPDEYRVVTLYLTVNRSGDLRIVPVQLPDSDGTHNRWHRSLMEAMEFAKDEWTRIKANRSVGEYERYQAPPGIPDPQWPSENMRRLVNLAFRGKLIDRLDHPVVQRLRGAP